MTLKSAYAKTELIDLIRYARSNIRHIENAINRPGPISEERAMEILPNAVEAAGALGSLESAIFDISGERITP